MKIKGLKSVTFVLLLLSLLAGLFFGKEHLKDEAEENESCLTMTVLDVSQGDSVLISCDGENMLVDAGVREAKDTVTAAVLNAGKLKMVFATHPHSDHIGAMAEVLRVSPPKLFIMPENEHTSSSYVKMIEALKELNTETVIADAGQKYYLGSACVSVLSPERGKESADLNNASIVLLIEFCGKSILLTGDAETPAEKVFSDKIPGKVDILKVGHHGSHKGTGDALLSKIRPTFAVISCGENNEYGYPHKETLERLNKYGALVYRTDISGTVVFTVKGGGINVLYER